MNFLYNLDYSEPLDESEFLGDISLIGDDKNEIIEKSTFIDSWFLALSEGMLCLKEGKDCIIDLPEEPYPLIIDTIKKTVEYGDQVIVVDDFEDMKNSLKAIINEFLIEVSFEKAGSSLLILRKFLDE